ncbi:MAG: cell envelope biogenesis protein OmpA [Ignavibacteriales bacterium]
MKKLLQTALCLFLLLSIAPLSLIHAQVITTASISGVITDDKGETLPAANVIAVHVPSGTQYGISSRADGKYNIPGMRVGGPYKITFSFVGFVSQSVENIYLELGQNLAVNVKLSTQAVQLGDVAVYGEKDAIIRGDRTGTETSIKRENLESMPTISRRLEDFTRLTPQSGRNSSFGGVDNRLNNITIDGSYFNNSFGLAGLPGDRTGVAPISLDAIEQVQVNVSPFDVRQGNFVGAGINSITRSGTNEFSGSVYYQFRNNDFVGDKAGDADFKSGTFDFNQVGVRLGGPIIQNKLFFFANFETDNLIQPGTTYLANDGTQAVTGQVTRVRKTALDSLSNFLRGNFGYETGPYEGYDHETPSTRFLVKFDYNLDNSNKLSLRYTHLDSYTDVLLSNSSSLGFGTRRSNLNGLNFQNSNYKILENIRSVIGEWNAIFSNNLTNNFIVGYTFNDESRESRGTFFPMVDILEGGSVYTTFGYEPFTPNNELRYNSFQIQNNLSWYLDDHNLTFGVSLERYESENIFFPGSQSAYVYNSLNDFYTDANGYLGNPARDTSTVTLRRFQVRWSNIPGQDKPVQPLEVMYSSLYAQDQWKVNSNFNVIAGIRFDLPVFGETGYKNPQMDTLFFKDEDGASVQYKTEKLPDANILFSPRVGVNWDVFGDKTTQVRGGTGIFTGKPAYVWISNQIGNNGMLTGFERLDNTRQRPFNPNPDKYKPTSVTGAPASQYELALTDPDFKFPQMWRTNVGVDQALPFGFIGTAEFLYSQDVNGVYYINANLKDPNTAFTGPDNRPRWTTGNKINSKIDNAIVLKNQDQGYYYNISASLEKPLADNWYLKAGYNYGVAKNTVDAGSIAFGSWNGNQHSGNPNNPGASFSANNPGSRLFVAASYSLDYFNFGKTTFSMFVDGYNQAIVNGFIQGVASYTFSGDLNGDGGTGNDLIYIPKDQSEMNFVDITSTSGGVTTTLFTAAQQSDAFEKFIQQDDYLSENRGKYAERNGVTMPMMFRADLSIVQEFYTEFMNKKNTFQVRLDILNFLNLLNADWGVGDQLVTTTPLISQGADAAGKARYQLQRVGGALIDKSFIKAGTVNDVYRIQLGVRYIFN